VTRDSSGPATWAIVYEGKEDFAQALGSEAELGPLRGSSSP